MNGAFNNYDKKIRMGLKPVLLSDITNPFTEVNGNKSKTQQKILKGFIIVSLS